MLIDLNAIGELNRKQLEELATIFLLQTQNGHTPLFPDKLFLSAIGARICYSDKPPITLIRTDKKINDDDERVRFLAELATAGHTSVFAHSPLFTEYVYGKCANTPMPYKCWWYDEKYSDKTTRRYICANARHLIEYDDSLVWYVIDLLGMRPIIPMKIYLAVENEVKGPFYELPSEPEEKPYILVFFIDKKPWQWFSVIAHGISVIASHQLVRHTWLNFNQRSHRYTVANGVVVPKTIADTVCENIFEATSFKARYAYKELCRYIPREDARFILPSGRETTIMASGPRFVWEDFIGKRNHKKAQWEIRWVAEKMNEVLDMTKR